MGSPNTDYGVGGSYWNSLQAGVYGAAYTNPPLPQTGLYGGYNTTPYPPDSYTGGSNSPSYSYPPSYPSPSPGSDNRQGSLTDAGSRLEQERQVAVQEGRTDLLPAIDAQLQNIDGAQQQIY